MSMATKIPVIAIFFMKHHGAGLSAQAELAFRLVDSLKESVIINLDALGRVKGQREQKLLALRRSADRVAFLKRPIEFVSDKAAKLGNMHSLILLFHEMLGQIARAASLVANQNHALSPKARIRMRRIS